MISLKGRRELKCGIYLLAGIILLFTQLLGVQRGNAQTYKRRRTISSKRRVPIGEADIVDRAVTVICGERVRDPQGSIPIDIMATQRALPLNDLHVIAGKARAQRLLPIAKQLVPLALSRIAAANNLKAQSLNWIIARVEAINTIKAEIEERDNSAWRPSEPHSIIFGTIFLTGLRSDEAMIAVLAHELTHAISGTDQALQPIFMQVGAKASQLERMPIGEAAAMELTCDMVGIQVMRDYIAQVSGRGTIRRRLTRALEKNCVSRDLADANHLSPRETTRLLLRLEPEITKAIAGTRGKQLPGKSKKSM
jgi:hypothetical protein